MVTKKNYICIFSTSDGGCIFSSFSFHPSRYIGQIWMHQFLWPVDRLWRLSMHLQVVSISIWTLERQVFARTVLFLCLSFIQVSIYILIIVHSGSRNNRCLSRYMFRCWRLWFHIWCSGKYLCGCRLIRFCCSTLKVVLL